MRLIKIKKYNIIKLAICFCSSILLGQQNRIDSLLQVLKISKIDSVKLNVLLALVENIKDDSVCVIYNNQAEQLAIQISKSNNNVIRNKGKIGLAEAYRNQGYFQQMQANFNSSVDYYKQALKIYEEVKDKKRAIGCLVSIWGVYGNQGDVLKELEYLEKSAKAQQEIGDKWGMALSLNNMGSIYSMQGAISKALDCCQQALKISEEINDKWGIAGALLNIGGIYKGQGDVAVALEYYDKCLKIREELGDKEEIVYALNRVGMIYEMRQDIQKALEIYERSLKIAKEIGSNKAIGEPQMLNYFAIGESQSLIGNVYKKQGNLQKALEYFFSSLKNREFTYDKGLKAISLNQIAEIYFEENKYNLAMTYSDSSLVYAKEVGYPAQIRNAEKLISEIYSAKENYEEAFKHYQLFILYRDSVNSNETRKASIKSQLKYEFEKKEAVMLEHQAKEKAITQERSRRQQLVICSVALGLLLVIAFAIFVFRSLRITRRQKHIIEEKQKDILDSIRYAKRIQQSLLPTDKYLIITLKRLRHEN